MYDRRIIRGSTYASLVMPATNLPTKPKARETIGEPQGQVTTVSEKERVSTPDPIPGRINVQVETEVLREELTDQLGEKVSGVGGVEGVENEFGAQTDFYIDRPVRIFYI